MSRIDIFRNDYLAIFSENNGIYLESFKKGFSLDQINAILSMHSDFQIINPEVIKFSLMHAPRPPQQFAVYRERINVEMDDDFLKAYIIYNLPLEDLDIQKRENLIKETFSRLKEKGIITGIKKELFFGDLKNSEKYLIAEGIPPTHGANSIIKMYEMKEATPEVREDGKVDFYELKLINRVKAGDWLGERIEATEGMPGQNIKGIPIRAVKGRTDPLIYDRNTIQEVQQNGKTILYSKINGAVNYVNGRITVSDHLEINGDVDFKTGNINLDGFLTINGTVMDGFSVEATKDIEINTPLGLGNVKSIISTEGSIYIKGGLLSKGKTEIRAAKDVFIKFIDNASIICGEKAHIGYSSINSTIVAKEVIMDSQKGQIIGGNITAEIRVSSTIIGSESEKRTIIEVIGFNRMVLKEEMDYTFRKISSLKEEQAKVKNLLFHLESQGQLNKYQSIEYNENFKRLYAVKEEIKNLEKEWKNISGYIKTHGEGEICASKRIYPSCLLIIKKIPFEVTTPMLKSCIYYQDGELKQI